MQPGVAWAPVYKRPAPTQPAQKPDLWKTQFLTDVMTSAWLLMYGRTDKKLAQRIADGSARWRTELYASAPTQPAQEPVGRFLKATYGDYGVLNWHPSYVAKIGDCLYTHPAPTQPAMSDADIEKVITKGVKSGNISWTGFKEDGEGKYTVPILSEHHCQIARAIEAHCRGGAK